MTSRYPRWIRDEIEWPRPLCRGARGMKARRVQEWLTLQGYHLRVDGDFGPATEWAVARFQGDGGLQTSGTVDDETSSRLTQPMRQVLEPTVDLDQPIGGTIVDLAETHLAEHPREVGGQNRGPWVRLYMRGEEGPAWAWCAGFVSFLVEQAAKLRGEPPAITTSFSCDAIAINAGHRGALVAGRNMSGRDVDRRPPPGSLFLTRRTATDWTHIGIVVEAFDEVFVSIEGNTNDDGCREGFETCRRIRGYRNKDFVVI